MKAMTTTDDRQPESLQRQVGSDRARVTQQIVDLAAARGVEDGSDGSKLAIASTSADGQRDKRPAPTAQTPAGA